LITECKISGLIECVYTFYYGVNTRTHISTNGNKQMGM
jgi:hypothetical protein